MQISTKRSWPRIATLVLLAMFTGEAVFLYIRWPFTSERVAHSLQGASASRVRFGRFQAMFFPHPGCVAQEVTFERGSHTLASARTLTITGSWAALFTLQHYVSRIEAEGARMHIPAEMPPREPAADPKKSPTTVGEMVANGAVLEIERTAAAPLTFTFAKLNLRNVSEQKAIQFETDLAIPLPPSRLLTSGSVGPWRNRDTPVMGSFRMQDGRLGALDGIDGTLSANGKFDGVLQKVHVSGQTDVPDFRVKRHRVRLQTDYSATVNGFTGDVYLDSVEAKFLQTLLHAKAVIESKSGDEGKTVYADFSSNRAQIQDLMRLVTKADQPALNGPITLRAHAVLPPGKDKFLRKVRLDGDFAIDDANFTKVGTQTKVNKLSARARGEHVADNDPAPDRVVSDVKGHVVLRNGTATLTRVSFSVPGATASGGGTYDLLDQRVSLTGHVAMRATVSEASSGMKSILLKPINIFFKRKDAGAVLPVSVTGYYPDPQVKVSLTGKRRNP